MTEMFTGCLTPKFPVKDTACYFSKHAGYIFFTSWFIVTHGNDCKTETCKNDGEKKWTTQEELAYPVSVICPMEGQVGRHLASFSPRGTHT